MVRIPVTGYQFTVNCKLKSVLTNFFTRNCAANIHEIRHFSDRHFNLSCLWEFKFGLIFVFTHGLTSGFSLSGRAKRKRPWLYFLLCEILRSILSYVCCPPNGTGTAEAGSSFPLDMLAHSAHTPRMNWCVARAIAMLILDFMKFEVSE